VLWDELFLKGNKLLDNKTFEFSPEIDTEIICKESIWLPPYRKKSFPILRHPSFLSLQLINITGQTLVLPDISFQKLTFEEH
jgi:hypothetical protein